MKTQNLLGSYDAVRSYLTLESFVTILILLPLLTPIIYILADKVEDLATDVMDHGYDLNVKTGLFEIAFSKERNV